MHVSYISGPHLDQPVADEAPTVDYYVAPATSYAPSEPGTQNYYIHPGTSGFIVEEDRGGVVNGLA